MHAAANRASSMYSRLEMLSITAILLALFTQAALGEEHYHIVPVNSTSLCEHYPDGTCFTLDTLDLSSGRIIWERSITLSFYPGEHLLTRNMTFNDAYNITLINEQQSNPAPRISCVANTRLVITKVDTFFMQGLVLYGCVSQGAVLSVLEVNNLNIQNCEFVENYCKSSYFCDESFYGGTTHIFRSTGVIRNSVYRSNVFNSDSRYNLLEPSSSSSICFSPGGGALYVEYSTIEIDLCLFENNIADQAAGGAIAMIRSTGNIINTTFVSNQAGRNGGALYFETYYQNNNIVMMISTSAFYNNSANQGGAIYAKRGGIDFSDSTSMIIMNVFLSSENVFSGNNASRGGAVYGYVAAKFESDSFTNNNAIDGAAIMFSGCLHMINCTFTEHRAESIVGSLILGKRVTATITNITIANNSRSINISHSDLTFWGHTIISNNKLQVVRGQDRTGGALTAYSSTITFAESSSTTEITSNEAAFGGGVYLQDSTLNVYSDMLIADNTATISGGGIFAHRSIINFENHRLNNGKYLRANHITMSNNMAISDGGGIYLTDSTLYNTRSSVVTISGNRADRFGGGIFLNYISKINTSNAASVFFPEHYNFNTRFSQMSLYVIMRFKSNSALKGGGIYVSDKTRSARQDICRTDPNSAQTNEQNVCFWVVSFLTSSPQSKQMMHRLLRKSLYSYFDQNTAVEGSDIYGGLLDRCLSRDGVVGTKYIRNTVSWNWGSKEHFKIVDGHNSTVYSIENTTELFNHVSSDPTRVCFCVDNIVDCTFTPPTVHKKKGETFTLSMAAVDQVGKPVNATLFSSLNLVGRKEGLKVGQQSRTLTDQCTELEYNVYYSESNAVLQLYPDGPCGNLGISKREVNIEFNNCTCPLGFEQQPSPIDCSCDCTTKLKPYIQNCWPEEGTFQLNDNNWIQSINATGFIVHECPFDFCLNEHLNISLVESSDIQCAFNRSGILCGKCAQGLSVVFANSRCQPCSNYYLFLLLPFGLAGIALVALILFLNVTVATGTIHGLIFYANILTANRSIFLPLDTSYYTVPAVFISWLNLDLGIETCFYNGMDSYGKLMLQLVFPAYLFFLLITIIVLCDRSQRIAHLFGKRNPEATLYTLFLLSYSKLIRTIIAALQFTTLSYPDGSQEIVWLYDANVMYFTSSQIPKFLAAIIITILGAMYTFLLLFGQLFNRCSEYRIMKWTSHKYYIHFMKAHHAPLSDKHRYWVGLLLLARLTHYLISAFANNLVIVLSALIMTLTLLVHKIVFKAYTKTFINLVETFFIANLSVLAGATLYVKASSGGDNAQQILSIVSVVISQTVFFFGILLYHTQESYAIELRIILNKIRLALRKRRDHDYHPVAVIESEDEDTEDESDEEMIELANVPEENATIEPYDPTRYITPPVIRSALPADQLREPALDELCPLTPADYNLQPAAPRTRHRQVPTFTEIVLRN